MSLIPLIFRDMAHMMRPLRMLENHMRMTEELLQPFMVEINKSHKRFPLDYKEQPESITHNDEKFEVKLDVQNFSPEDITVKTAGENAIQVEAKHEKKEDSGFITRHFVRKFVIPRGHELKNVVSTLSSDGILTITAPRKVDPALEEKIIKVNITGPERVEDKKIEDKKVEEKEG
ncbi:protein lethal(2)essential for life-like [Onthophagus taurus]|uniref:protein lethal(2)essential for life-like n=1 Tax=Onthophagus taurus TaxID=166361 RepID=UPI000C202D16|nr:protein lethal(2)essential for life-like [Onthophagus taurus]